MDNYKKVLSDFERKNLRMKIFLKNFEKIFAQTSFGSVSDLYEFVFSY